MSWVESSTGLESDMRGVSGVDRGFFVGSKLGDEVSCRGKFEHVA